MTKKVLAAAVGVAAATVAASVTWIAPPASAGTPFCDSMANAQQIHECNCGFDFVPASQDYHDCLAGKPVAPPPPQP